jgi:TonB-linked SusC/RagA family outer membrane protein
MRKKNIILLALFACMGLQAMAQSNNQVTGQVLDKRGNPVAGALVTTVGSPNNRVATDRDGKFSITATESDDLRITTSDEGYRIVEAMTGAPMTIVMERVNQAASIGYEKMQTLEETTSSVYTVTSEELNQRSSRDIGNELFGNVLGLTALQGAGSYYDQSNTFFIRGLQTLEDSGNKPLILIDGIERDLTLVTPEEVESVTVLKDAAAVALYGYKGANGAINIVTKRGQYGVREVKLSYDHSYNMQLRRPEFVNAHTYASAMNEALGYDGRSPRYSANELEAFKSGNYPYLYPNVDWMNETFKNFGASNRYNASFRGGGTAFRYYAMANLQNNNGFIKNPGMNDGYSTQDMYSAANLRTNLDIDLTPSTQLELKLLGTLTEMRQPGDETDLWDIIYTLPSAVFPIKTHDGLWGGNSTWATTNPVSQSQAAGYTKAHRRSLYADMALKQDLSALLPGLGGSFRLAYDNAATYVENHSRTYSYSSYTVTEWLNGAPNMDNLAKYTGGSESGLNDDADIPSWARAFNFDIGLNYQKVFGDHSIYSQVRWDYEYRDINGLNNSLFRQNYSLYGHYGYKGKYFVDLSLVASAANKLAPSSRWGFSPTVSAAWVLSKEDFMSGSPVVDFLKLRASFGIINRDNIPMEKNDDGNLVNVEGYWKDLYVSGSGYNLTQGYTSPSSWQLKRLATQNPRHEQAWKYNVGLDAVLFGGLNLTVEGFYQTRKNIWVEAAGIYSSVLGFESPYENEGIVNSYGAEFGVDYFKKFGDFSFNIGGNFTWNKNKIKEQYEELRAYDNLMRTNKPVGQIFGLIADGFFRDPADIANSVPHTFNQVRPGDIKYRDVNGDGRIDENDVTAIGYNTLVPELYYSFKLGAEYKGFGLTAQFQGVSNYSAMLDTKSLYWPLINNTNISQHYYDNRWTPQNQNAKYPALSSQSSNNNYQNNTIWLADRSFLKLRYVELYYTFPKAMLRRTGFMEDAKLYVRGTDLLCFDKIKIADPESYGPTNPLTRSLVVGLTFGF